MSNRPAGQRIIVSYPHDSDYDRHGVLVKVVEVLPPHSLEREFKNCTDIWEVLLDATQYRPQTTRTYNEGWLLREDWYEQVYGKTA